MKIQPKNWQDFQHYKDRSPIWIKLHKRLLDNYEYHCLPLASKALAPLLWLLASEYEDGIIEAPIEKIAFRLRVTIQELNHVLESLENSDFFDVYRDDSDLLSGRYQDSSPRALAREEKRRDREETEIEKEREPERETDVVVPVKPSRPARTKISDEEWMASLKTNPAYQHVDIDSEYGKMAAWCQVKQKQPTRARFINWINRIDKPMSAGVVIPIGRPMTFSEIRKENDMRELERCKEWANAN